MVVTQVGVSLGEATIILQVVVEDSFPTTGMATLQAVVSLGTTTTALPVEGSSATTTIITIQVEGFLAITIMETTTLEASSITVITLGQGTVLSLDLPLRFL